MLEFGDAHQRVITYGDDTTNLEDKKEREEKEKQEEEKEKRSMLQKTTKVHLVVAALIATVTFATCITMPGGFIGGEDSSHPRFVLLRSKAAFKAFVITDTISMVLSSPAVFIDLLIPFLSNSGNLSFWPFILWAMIAMGLAFVAGTYFVLMPSLDLAIANGIIGLTFFAIFFCVSTSFLCKLLYGFQYSLFLET